MDLIVDIIKVIILSIVEGITEFLPVSSTGHLILVNRFVQLSPQGFANAFSIIIQLGAILSVVVIYFRRLNPWDDQKLEGRRSYRDRGANWQTRLYHKVKRADPETMDLWKKVLVGILPGLVLGLLFDDFIDAHLMNFQVVTATLLIYGVIILLIENWNAKRKRVRFEKTSQFDYKTAFLIGLFQCLAMVPGTSRSAATIIGAMLLGSGRVAAAEFSFFLAIPTMLGATFLKVVKNVGAFRLDQWLLIALGFALSFLVAYVVIKKFMSYVKSHDFKIFGYYRIALSLLLLLYMFFAM